MKTLLLYIGLVLLAGCAAPGTSECSGTPEPGLIVGYTEEGAICYCAWSRQARLCMSD